NKTRRRARRRPFLSDGASRMRKRAGRSGLFTVVVWVLLALAPPANADAPASFRSHPPMRPLPGVPRRELVAGPALFVDAARGDDGAAGTERAPLRTLAVALRRLNPGETLYLRGGTYYEKVFLTRSGTAEAPITICAYPGERVVLDGSLREFQEEPETSWEP